MATSRVSRVRGSVRSSKVSAVDTASLPVSADPTAVDGLVTLPELAPEALAQLTKALGDALRAARTDYVPLSDAERRHGAPFRPGAEVVLRVLGRAIDGHRAMLPSDMPSIDMAFTELDKADQLRPLAELAAQLTEVLSDRVRRSERVAQRVGSTTYQTLEGVAVYRPSLRQALAPAREYLRIPRRSKAPSPEKEVPPTVTPTKLATTRVVPASSDAIRPARAGHLSFVRGGSEVRTATPQRP